MSLITPEQMWAQYLYGQQMTPIGDQLLNESFIRAQGATSSINIAAADYMAGPGSHINGAYFGTTLFFFQHGYSYFDQVYQNHSNSFIKGAFA